MTEKHALLPVLLAAWLPLFTSCGESQGARAKPNSERVQDQQSPPVFSDVFNASTVTGAWGTTSLSTTGSLGASWKEFQINIKLELTSSACGALNADLPGTTITMTVRDGSTGSEIETRDWKVAWRGGKCGILRSSVDGSDVQKMFKNAQSMILPQPRDQQPWQRELLIDIELHDSAIGTCKFETINYWFAGGGE